MKKMCFGLLALALVGCAKKDKIESVDVNVVDVAAIMREAKDLDSSMVAVALDENRVEVEAFMKTLGADSVTVPMLQQWSASAPVAIFTPPVDSVYADRQSVKNALGYTLAAAGNYGLEFSPRHYAEVVYGRPESIMFVDSVMLVALNHYLGADYDGYGRWPEYIRAQKTPEQLPYDIAEALVGTDYPFSAQGDKATLLANMLYQGALTKAKMALVENSSLASALGYSENELKWLDDNSDKLWQEMVEMGILYDTSADRVRRWIAPTPAVVDTPTRWPGRAGRYMGYILVDKYMKNNPGTSLSYLLSPAFYTSNIF